MDYRLKGAAWILSGLFLGLWAPPRSMSSGSVGFLPLVAFIACFLCIMVGIWIIESNRNK